MALYAFGSEGLEELKTKIDPTDPQQTLIGFLRVDTDFVSVNHSSDRPGEGVEEEDECAKYLLLSYVPKDVSGVRRGAYLALSLVSAKWTYLYGFCDSARKSSYTSTRHDFQGEHWLKALFFPFTTSATHVINSG